MYESKNVFITKIITHIVEKEVDKISSQKQLSNEEKQQLYLDTFNYFNNILRDFD